MYQYATKTEIKHVEYLVREALPGLRVLLQTFHHLIQRRAKPHILPKHTEHIAAKPLYVTAKCKAEQKVSLEAGSSKLEKSFFAQCSYAGNQEE